MSRNKGEGEGRKVEIIYETHGLSLKIPTDKKLASLLFPEKKALPYK